MARVVQYSVDILIENDRQNGIDWEDYIAESLEKEGVCVLGTEFSGDMTEHYKEFIEEYSKL